MSTLFAGSRAKLDRAKAFIDELDTGLAAHNMSRPLSAEWDLSGNEPAIRMLWKEIAPSLLCTLGDALHNMRSALDLMACELARVGGKSDKGVYFPFAASQSELDDAIKKKKFHRAGQDATILLKTFAPYKGGNAYLRAIHDLDIVDKHASVLVTQRMTKDVKLTYNLDAGSNPPITVVGANFEHNFLDGPLAGLPLIQTLKELVELVDSILQAFHSLVDSRGT